MSTAGASWAVSQSPAGQASTAVVCDASLAAEDDASYQARADASPRGEDEASHPGPRDGCAWCEQPIPAKARRDAVCCSVRCRQARHRFLRSVGRAEAEAVIAVCNTTA